MDFQEAKYEEVEDIDHQKDGWRCLGDYGWGFSNDASKLIKKITKEDGWRILKIVDADQHRQNWHDRDYFFISDKYKVFVGVPQQHWDSDSFKNYLERAIGKQHRFVLTAMGTNGKSKHKVVEVIWGTDKNNVAEKFQKMLKDQSYRFNPDMEYEIVSIK